MIPAFFRDNFWPGPLLFVLVYLSDYYLTLYCARQFKTRLAAHLEFQGSFELTPQFEKDIDLLKTLSPAFLWRLGASTLLIPMAWLLSTRLLPLPEFYFFLLGGLFLQEAAVHLRHFRNLAIIYYSRRPGSLNGKLTQSRWISLKTSGFELLTFALAFALIGFINRSPFFMGGALFTLATGWRHLRLANQHPPKLSES